MRGFDPRDWYWIVADDESRVFSSKARGYVLPNTPAYVAWAAADETKATRIISEAELWDVLAQQAPELANHIPAVLDKLKDRTLEAMNGSVGELLFKALYNLDSRVRVLESRPAITPAQFRAGLKAL